MRQTILTVEVNDVNDPTKGGVVTLPALTGVEFHGELSHLSEEERAYAEQTATLEVSGETVTVILACVVRAVVTEGLGKRLGGKRAERAAQDGAAATGFSR